MRLNLIRLSKAAPGTLPFAKATLYKMHHLGRYPGIFLKLGGALFVDIDALDALLEAGRGMTSRQRGNGDG
jgi:hypothetical protein